jgi:hypothetical protein
LIDIPLALGLYTKRLSQNSSQLSCEIIVIHTRLSCGLIGVISTG